MKISKLKIENYRCFEKFEIAFPNDIAIIVGNNESGKSTILEALNLALTGKVNGRSIFYEISPFHFNQKTIHAFVRDACDPGVTTPPAPKIRIEVFFTEDESSAEFKGRNNSDDADACGVTFEISVNEVEYGDEYVEYIANPDPRTVPIEYYSYLWTDFAGNITSPSKIKLDTCLVDATHGKHETKPDSFMADLVKNLLTPKESAELRLKHRQLKETFDKERVVVDFNSRIQVATSDISDKEFTYSVDMTSKASWENGFSTYLDGIPLPMIGKGEQTAVKARLALHRENDDALDRLCLIEEPENHLSFSKMSKLLSKIRAACEGKQLLITTHSSFVANKLGLENIVLLSKEGITTTLRDLNDDTQKYFRALPGFDTLRILLSEKAILVEGPSDELIVQKAYLNAHQKLPIDDGIDVISVRGLSVKRFLEIGDILKLKMTAVLDNDGSAETVKNRFAGYLAHETIELKWDPDEAYPTLEPQIVKANLGDLKPLCRAIGIDEASTEQDLISHMTNKNNKTSCSLKIFHSQEPVLLPDYINDAIA